MKYFKGQILRRMMSPLEKPIVELKVSRFWLTIRYLIAGALAVCCALTTGFVSLTLLYICLFVLLNPVQMQFYRELGCTDKRLIGRIGWLWKMYVDVPLSEIGNVTCSRSLSGMVLRYSSLRIETTFGNYTFRFVKNAEEMKEQITSAVDRYLYAGV